MTATLIDPVDQPGPVCPHCGGGPIVRTPLGTVCKSCARVLSRRAGRRT